MKNKKNLKSNISINDDYTKKEQEIQKKFRDMAREERKKGNRALVAYKKIQVNGEWKSWNDIAMKQ